MLCKAYLSVLMILLVQMLLFVWHMKECKGWFNKNLPWEEIKDGKNTGVSCILARKKSLTKFCYV